MLEGLKKAEEIISKEMVIARELNAVMALGMSQVLMLVRKEIKKEEEQE